MKHDLARQRLLELREELAARHERIGKHIENRDEPLPADSKERAGELANRETMEGIDDNAVAELRQIDHALTRLDIGEYGKCESCRQVIQEARLALLPFATQCVSCAAASPGRS